MLEETSARLRTHHKNLQRYRQLLDTGLTDFEREYIGKRLSEEQAAIETLSAEMLTAAASEATAQILSADPLMQRSTAIA
jgi:5-bromo-4-chloroindolyl phosphate hydrolysis protein